MITLTLSRQMVQKILDILSRAAYNEVAEIIAEIIKQASAQKDE